jgi:gliding motility-associated-like protein
MILVWVSSVAMVTGQGFYTVNRGSVHEYKVTKVTTDTNIYTWQVFTDVGLSSQASVSQAVLTPMGVGRENEIKINWRADGDYYLLLTVSDPNGCTNWEYWHFVVDQTDDKPTARIAGPSIVTLGSCDVAGHIIDAGVSGGGGLAFSWSPSIYLDNVTSSKPKFIPGKTTRYHLTVTDSRGQTDTTSVLIVVANPPKAVTDKNVFVKTPNANILLSGNKSTGTGLTYLWLSKEGIIRNGETTSVAEVSGLGKYYLKVTDSFGCVSKDSVSVGLYTQAIRDTSNTNMNFAVDINVLMNDIPKKKLDPSTLRIVTPPQNGMATVVGDSLVSYLPNQYFIGSDNFVYSICDYFKNCDQATVLVLVNDVPFFVPEAFSPNGDGINDKFEIKGLSKYKSVEIDLFNRWGNLVYHSNNYGGGQGKSGFWDGTASQGVRTGSGPVPSGTYFYILKLDSKEKINGAIYLDR